MKKILSLIICISVGASVLAQKEDIKAIKTVYAAYDKAASKHNAEEAVRCLTTSSIECYSKLLGLCKTADSTTLAAMPAVDIFMTLTIRARTDASLLCGMNTGKDLLLNALQEGMTGAALPLESITIQGDTAYATVKSSTVQHRFVKESMGWKVDLTQTFAILSQRFEIVTQKLQISKQELCVATLKQSGIEVPATIWEPTCKK